MRDEALWRYVSMLVGEDSLEFDLQLARPLHPFNVTELAPGEHAHSSRTAHVRAHQARKRLALRLSPGR